MAPEVVKQEPLHRRADFYFFGVRLWERLSHKTTGTTFLSQPMLAKVIHFINKILKTYILTMVTKHN